jgi:hypothetical protein
MLGLFTGQGLSALSAVNTERVGIVAIDVGTTPSTHNLHNIRGSMILQYVEASIQLMLYTIPTLIGTTFQSGSLSGTSRALEEFIDFAVGTTIGFSNATGGADTLTLKLVPSLALSAFQAQAVGSCTIYSDYNPNA